LGRVGRSTSRARPRTRRGAPRRPLVSPPRRLGRVASEPVLTEQPHRKTLLTVRTSGAACDWCLRQIHEWGKAHSFTLRAPSTAWVAVPATASTPHEEHSLYSATRLLRPSSNRSLTGRGPHIRPTHRGQPPPVCVEQLLCHSPPWEGWRRVLRLEKTRAYEQSEADGTVGLV